MADTISRVGKEVDPAAYGPGQAAEEKKFGVPGPAVRECLLALNPSLRGPIGQLLDRKFYDCAAAPEEQPKNCYETVAYVKGLDYLSRRQVYEESVGPIMADQDKVSELLAAGGYRKVAESFPFHNVKGQANTVELVVGVKLSAIPKNLKSGDLVLFGGRGLNSKGEEVDRFTHAMVYLGRHGGKHYVFEKINKECGPGSPYQIISLEAVLVQLIGMPSTHNNIYIDRVFALRSFNKTAGR